GNAGNRRRCAEFVGFAPGQRTFPRTETEIAAARRDVDIAYAADHGIRIDGNFRVGSKAERGAAAEQARNDRLSKARTAGECWAIPAAKAKARPRLGDWKSERSVLHNYQSQCRNSQLFHLCSLPLLAASQIAQIAISCYRCFITLIYISRHSWRV